MNQSPLVALVGNPNAGKTALFNALTGARQKVGNYPGVTVERHSGRLALNDGRPVELVDLPGTYSLDPSSPDEAVTRDVVLGRQEGERLPDALADTFAAEVERGPEVGALRARMLDRIAHGCEVLRGQRLRANGPNGATRDGRRRADKGRAEPDVDAQRAHTDNPWEV